MTRNYEAIRELTPAEIDAVAGAVAPANVQVNVYTPVGVDVAVALPGGGSILQSISQRGRQSNRIF